MEREAKHVTVGLNVWYRNDGQIGLSMNNGWFITTVNDHPGSARQHGNLYKKLRQLLIDAGKWPEGAA